MFEQLQHPSLMKIVGVSVPTVVSRHIEFDAST